MPVYVDPAIYPMGRMMMCHLWGDTEAELFAMVDKIGVSRRWIQGHRLLSLRKFRRASWVHFDISKGKRSLAVAAGAVETDRYGPSMHVAKLKGDTEMIERIERLRARKAAA